MHTAAPALRGVLLPPAGAVAETVLQWHQERGGQGEGWRMGSVYVAGDELLLW